MAWLERMHAELVAEVGSREAFAEMARGWLTGCMAEVFGPVWRRLQADPVSRATVRSRDGMGAIMRAGPDQVLGRLSTYRKQPGFKPDKVLYSQRAWARLLDGLSERPYGVQVEMLPLDGAGYWQVSGWCVLRVRWDELSPGWARFSFTAGAGPLTNWPEAGGMQESWAGFVRRQAAQISACAGGMTDDMWPRAPLSSAPPPPVIFF